MTYDQIDFLCDIYNPLLFLVLLGCLGYWLAKYKAATIGKPVLAITLSIAGSYGLMALDKAVGAWQLMGLDFSTHTIVSLVLAWWIIYLSKKIQLVAAVIAFTLIYWLTMLYQHYHSFLDILSTAITGLCLLFFTQKIAGSRSALIGSLNKI